jgi:PAS domain S-box-containing protein
MLNRLQRIWRFASGIAPLAGGTLAVCLAFTVLVGWAYGSRLLTSFGHDLLPMAPSTALLLVLNGAALILTVWRQDSRTIRIAALGAGLLALVGSSAFAVLSLQGIQPDFESFGLAPSTMPDGMAIGHISPIVAVWLTVSAVALLLLRLPPVKGRAGYAAAFVLTSCLALSSQLVLTANLGGTPFGFGSRVIVPSLPTAIALVFLGGGLLVASARALWPGTTTDAGRGGEFVFHSVLLFLLLASCIFVIAFLHIKDFSYRYQTGIEQQLAAVAELKVRDIAQYRRERLGDASLFLNNPDITRLTLAAMARPPEGTSRRFLASWLGKLRDAYAYDRVILLSPDGSIHVSATDAGERVDTVIGRGCSRALKSRRILVEDLYRSDVNGKVYLAILVPVYDGNRPLAVFALRIDPEVYLFPYVRSWPGQNRSSESLLVRRDGNEVVFLTPLRHRPDPPLTLRVSITQTRYPAVRAVLGSRGIVEGVDYAGMEVIACVAAIPDSPWYIVARTSIAEAVTPVRERLSIMLILLVSLVGLAGLALAYIAMSHRARTFRDQFQHAESMRRADERFRKLVESARDGIVLTEAGRICADVNPWACKLFGLPRDQMIGRPFASLFGHLDGSSATPHFPSLAGLGPLATETSIHRPDGSFLPVEVSAWVLPDGSAQAIVRDISERKIAQELQQNIHLHLEERVQQRTEQLEATNRELETFSYSVSHDLRSPLRGIDGWSLALLEDYGESLDPRAKEFLGRVRSETQRMGLLIDDLLRLARVSRTDMQPVAVDLTGLARRIGNELRGSEEGRETVLTVDEGLIVTGDPSLLEIAFRNLLENAFKFTSGTAQPRIAVGRRDGNGRPVFFVKDNGAGFDMAYAKKLFAPFQRMHTLAEFPGTGIGLAIVQRIIHRHGGTIWAEAAKNAGATFHFTLEKIA